MSVLEIESSAEHTLIFSGDLNYSDITSAIWEQSKRLLATASGPIEIDLGKVNRSDSTGVALLVACVQQARKLNKPISLINLTQQMQAIIRVSGLEKMLPIKNSR